MGQSANRKSGLLFFISWIFLGIWYYQGHYAMLVDDGINGLLLMDASPSSEIWTSYGTNCWYQSFWIQLKLLYRLCGTNTSLWFLFFSMMHALNVTLLYKFLNHVLWSSDERYDLTALFGALFFLFSPFLSENILWTATHHYSISLALLLIMLLRLHSIWQTNSKGSAYLIVIVLFLISLTTHEISFVYPLIFIAFYVFKRHSWRSETAINRRRFSLFIGTLIFISATYIGLLFYSRGILLPHYYSGEIEFVTSELVAHFAKRILSFIGLVTYYPVEIRRSIIDSQSVGLWFGVNMSFIFLITLICLFLKRSKRLVLLFLVSCSALLLIPTTHIGVSYLFKFENHRYLYFFSVFAYPLIAYMMSLGSKKLQLILSIMYAGLLLVFAYQVASSKKQAAHYLKNYIEKFQDTSMSRTFIYNMPYNVCEQRVFHFGDGFTNLYDLRKGTNIGNRVMNITSHTVYSHLDSVRILKTSDSSFESLLITPGEWLIYNGMGVSSEEKEHYRYNVGEWGFTKVEIKNMKPSDNILYFSKGEFIKIND